MRSQIFCQHLRDVQEAEGPIYSLASRASDEIGLASCAGTEYLPN